MFEYYNLETKESTINYYVESVSEYEVEYIREAFQYFRKTHLFMPKISEILEYITKLKNENYNKNYNKKMIEGQNSERVDDLIDIADILKDFLKKIK